MRGRGAEAKEREGKESKEKTGGRWRRLECCTVDSNRFGWSARVRKKSGNSSLFNSDSIVHQLTSAHELYTARVLATQSDGVQQAQTKRGVIDDVEADLGP
jgi:hypothetical protein